MTALGSGDDRLEPDFASDYAAWKADPGPATNAAMLKRLEPTIQGAIRTHVGAPNPLLVSRARVLALGGLRSYDPTRGRLQNHMYNHLQGLKRVARHQSQVIAVPERLAQDRYQLDDATRQLGSELGREPTDAEVLDRTGFAPRRLAALRRFRHAVAEGSLDDPETGAAFQGSVRPGGPSPWAAVVYNDLDPYHQKVMEYALGLNGRRPLANGAIAAKLQRSPGAISQAKLRIQRMLDEETALSPF